MTVEAYLRSLVMGLEFTIPVLERCARSPMEVCLEPLTLDEDIDAFGVKEEEEEGGDSTTPEPDTPNPEPDTPIATFSDSVPMIPLVPAESTLSPEMQYQRRLDYASSTLYYSVLGVFTGGGFSEQVGNVRVSQSRYVITQADRERYKLLGDMLRRKWGFPIEENLLEESGMFDASHLRRRPKPPCQCFQREP